MANNVARCLLRNINSKCTKTSFPMMISQRNVSSDPTNIVTHTGQKFDPEDTRLTRFVDRPMEVNERWAINLVDEEPPAPKADRVVSCNGGGGPLGHPKVYINLDKPGNHICGYCGLRFYKEDHHH